MKSYLGADSLSSAANDCRLPFLKRLRAEGAVIPEYMIKAVWTIGDIRIDYIRNADIAVSKTLRSVPNG
jgi:hypothetical protein